MAASNTDKRRCGDLGRVVEDEAPGVELVEGAVVVGPVVASTTASMYTPSRLTTSDSDPFFLHREARRREGLLVSVDFLLL